MPPRNPKSRIASTQEIPSIVQVPVTTASVSPVRFWSLNKRSLYDVLDENDRGSNETRDLLIS